MKSLLETIVDITQGNQADQIIVCTVDDRAHTENIGKFRLQLGNSSTKIAFELRRYMASTVDKVVDDNRNLNTKRIYLKAEKRARA